MKKIINKREYDTENAKLIKKSTFGYYGDPEGYEETLYQTNDGYYFIYVLGGANSPYPQENILRLAKTKVDSWVKNHP